MKNTKENTGCICAECAEARKAIWQKNNAYTILEKGKHVQIEVGVEGEDRSEHLWFEIVGFEDEQNIILGQLRNDPVFLPLTYGAVLDFPRSEVENYI